MERTVVDTLCPLPNLGEVLHHGRLGGQVRPMLPEDHRLVHPPPEKVGADRPHEVVHERVHLLVRLGPRTPLYAAGAYVARIAPVPVS